MQILLNDLCIEDFRSALKVVKPSVSTLDFSKYDEFTMLHGINGL